MNKRLVKLLCSGKIGGNCILDTYNQAVYKDIAPTITTRVDASGHIYVMERVRFKKPQLDNGMKTPTVKDVLKYLPDEECFFDVRHCVYGLVSGVLPFAITTRIGANNQQYLKVKMDKVKIIGKCWASSQNGSVYDTAGLSPTIVCGNHSGVEPKIIEPNSPSIRIPQATSQGYAEVQEGGVFDAAYPDSKTRRGRVQEGGSVTPTILTSNELSLYEGVKNGQFRIRKLTPRECFRLMGVSEENIDKIQAAGISNSQQYKMAGNSIVVDTLYHIFKKMFIDKESEQEQLTLF